MWLVKLWLIFILFMETVYGKNCRVEGPRMRNCTLCNSDGVCSIRAALLLPKNTSFDASASAVESVFELALKDPIIKSVFPHWLTFNWTSYDVKDCDAAYSIISAMDAYNYDCADVFFGPSCDFALAAVSRVIKFLDNSGIPLITTGGLSFDFVKKKRTCDDEYYMTVRTGMVGARDITFFIIDLMHHFNWQQLLIITEPNAQHHVAGTFTCHLMMKTLANFLKEENIIYTPWDTTSDGGLNYTENLKFYLGYKYTNSLNINAEGRKDAPWVRRRRLTPSIK